MNQFICKSGWTSVFKLVLSVWWAELWSLGGSISKFDSLLEPHLRYQSWCCHLLLICADYVSKLSRTTCDSSNAVPSVSFSCTLELITVFFFWSCELLTKKQQRGISNLIPFVFVFLCVHVCGFLNWSWGLSLLECVFPGRNTLWSPPAEHPVVLTQAYQLHMFSPYSCQASFHASSPSLLADWDRWDITMCPCCVDWNNSIPFFHAVCRMSASTCHNKTCKRFDGFSPRLPVRCLAVELGLVFTAYFEKMSQNLDLVGNKHHWHILWQNSQNVPFFEGSLTQHANIF